MGFQTRETKDLGTQIKVKTLYMIFAEGGTDEQREAASHFATHEWWAAATDLAVKHGFAGAYAGGRSGGWLSLFYSSQNRPVFFSEAANNKEENEKYEKFLEELGPLFASFPYLFDEVLKLQMET